MFAFNGITKIDLSIIIGIVGIDVFISNHSDIPTVPFSFTLWLWVTFTIKFTEIWAVFSSISVFNIHDTSVDFTFFNVSIEIEVT
jgi:hypothetical protein